jgi:hypothetical protein
MQSVQSEKLKRYLMNADPFLWDILEAKNKRERIKSLRSLGFLSVYSENSVPTYSRINQDLLVELGIEGILKKIIGTRIRTLFTEEQLSQLRRFWEQGQVPDMNYLKQERLYQQRFFNPDDKYEGNRISGHRSPAHVFVQIHQKEFVERWTVFAGLWFEEIEPWLEEFSSGKAQQSQKRA